MALVCGAFGLANANANTIDSVIVDVVNVSALQDDGFKPVKFDELSEPIQKAISELNDEYALKSLAWNSEKQQAKVVLVSNESGTEKVIIFDNEGKEID